ncbi:polyprenyl synthetase [Nocardia sp. SYP-A9097]|uniref:polyprenyl synthetase n=1 Tax=Nocardia sp. SYP-A9097 TaxID=2663237 RepID=UPI00129B6D89|nr:polyprenyl synthetase [Nocardia sp. SYP-A9097]MRH92582.1 polyprenyl synthetase [Nocardia sp. SYP-A9097]
MGQGAFDSGSRGEDAVLLAVGLADAALSRVGPVVNRAFRVLRRSDTADLVGAAGADLKARGRLVLDRYDTVPQAHLEYLAQRAQARRGNA